MSATRHADRADRWWQTAVVLEVYPRSFADSNGDGIGDLRGVIERLPYLESLGVDGIWLTPFQRSPQVDQGYDISDPCDVDPMFGTLADLDELLERAHAAGIRVLVDLVPNHTSVAHPLFQAAVAAGPGSAERAMFHVAPDRGDGRPPNNWVSVFGGPAWSRMSPGSARDTDWYLHLFSPAQPDWNWRNPAVGDMYEDVLRFWLDRGVDGVRVDVAHGLFKAEGLPDAPDAPTVIDGLRANPLAADQEPVHDVYRRWRRVTDGYRPPRMLVGEVNLDPERAGRYTRPDEMHQAFAFAFARLGWEPAEWRRVGDELEAVRRRYGAPPTWALENHDLVRTATRLGDGERGPARARAALVALLGLPGAVYVYQGQELGLPEVDVPVDARQDPMWARGGVSRDGARVPIPWTAAPEGAHGFSPGRTPPHRGCRSPQAGESAPSTSRRPTPTRRSPCSAGPCGCAASCSRRGRSAPRRAARGTCPPTACSPAGGTVAPSSRSRWARPPCPCPTATSCWRAVRSPAGCSRPTRPRGSSRADSGHPAHRGGVVTAAASATAAASSGRRGGRCAAQRTVPRIRATCRWSTTRSGCSPSTR
ncbi:alpha-amylase family glycosyl hydrolase [Cellulomonas sp. ATA003]|uniref:alpha-amylase family glycosyl hydrolase n=1 Tax=Cellulomonas sp. ATA003 TaxID=3073064 RepID=UPI0028739D3A|nr:alpha-amylase family glycosyl hydrolase [Cellulomonas sp. ATA003]WNB84842.1 alpha-amylase family glycosyl hydrolase [Cellulomonas sp. ATA003]